MIFFGILFLVLINGNISQLINENIYNNNEINLKNAGSWDLTGNIIDINDNDPENNWLITAATKPWCSGSGRWSDPFIIENVTMNAQTANYAVHIQNSNSFFIIRNCTFFNYYIGGIYLSKTNNGFVLNNTVHNGNGSVIL